MCGLLGSISREPVSPALWTAACKLQAHRGPDDSGEWNSRVGDWNLAVAHQRLSILDLSPTGAQPMIHPVTGSVLVYNGEIYNFVELKAELKAVGVNFIGHSDTEVLLHGLEHWGIEATLAKLNGMWAFAWIDRAKRKVHLSRDRCGEKPLYIAVQRDRVLFASEMKAILRLTGGRRALNVQAIAEFMKLGILDADRHTMFLGIEQVPASGLLTLSLDGFNIVTHEYIYWQCPVTNNAVEPFPQFVDRVRETFLDSVKIRLRSDVSVGILLSGGLDSSSITGAAHALGAKNMTLLSLVSDDPSVDESPFIEAVGRHFGWPVTKIKLPSDPQTLFGHLKEVIGHMEAPVGSLSNVAHYLLMRAARDNGITVVLSGQGGDEVFCGYRKYLGFHLQSLVRQNHPFTALRTLGSFLRNGTMVNQFRFAEAKRYLPSKIFERRQSNLGPRLSMCAVAAVGLLPDESLGARQRRDLMQLSVPTLNHFEDRMSMAWSREIRLPFLDHRLIEMLISAPAEYKLAKGWSKYALRSAVVDLLPPEITWRKDKQGFSNPEGVWMKTTLKEIILRDFLHPEARIFRLGLLDREAVLNEYERYCAQKPQQGRVWSKDIFQVIALEVWLGCFSEFIEGAN
jgi:asparagine synthase (glutamine-hydrolysing)